MASCNIEDLIRDAACLQCLSPYQLSAIQTQLFCEIASLPPPSGETCLICGSGEPVEPATCDCSLYLDADPESQTSGGWWFWDSAGAQWISTGSGDSWLSFRKAVEQKAADQPAGQPLGWFEFDENITFSPNDNVLLWHSISSVHHLEPFLDFTQLFGGTFVNEFLPRTFRNGDLVQTQIVQRDDQNPLAGLFSQIGVPFGSGPPISELTMILCFRLRSLSGGGIIAGLSDPRLFQAEEVNGDPGISIITDDGGLSVIGPGFEQISGGSITPNEKMIVSFRFGTDFLSMSLKNNGIEQIGSIIYGQPMTANAVNFSFGWGVVLQGQSIHVTESDLFGALVCTTSWSDNEIVDAERYFASRFGVDAYTYVQPS